MNSTKFRLITNQKPYEIDPVLRSKCIKNAVKNAFQTPTKYDKNTFFNTYMLISGQRISNESLNFKEIADVNKL